MQVYLVTGGEEGSIPLSSTEVLVDGAANWQYAGELPLAMFALKGVSLNNDIFMTGKIIILQISFIIILVL